jgi:hypothetical protein
MSGMREPRHQPAFVPPDPAALETLRAKAEGLRELRHRQEQEIADRRRLLGLMSADELDHARIHDLDAAAACHCSCHPAPAHVWTHGEGVCACQKSDEQRRADREAALQALREGSAELEQAFEAERAALQTVAGELGVTIEQAGGAAPYQILGQVDGMRFYLRERHEEWRLQIPDEEAGDLGDPIGVKDGTYVIAEGWSNDLYDPTDPVKPLKVAVAAVRAHLTRRSCGHPDARAFCPDCGAARP